MTLPDGRLSANAAALINNKVYMINERFMIDDVFFGSYGSNGTYGSNGNYELEEVEHAESQLGRTYVVGVVLALERAALATLVFLELYVVITESD